MFRLVLLATRDQDIRVYGRERQCSWSQFDPHTRCAILTDVRRVLLSQRDGSFRVELLLAQLRRKSRLTVDRDS